MKNLQIGNVERRERHSQGCVRKGRMPYIPVEDREKLDHWIDNVLFHLSSISKKEGAINYIFTRILDDVYGKGGYSAYNAVAGILGCVDKEFYRRKVAPYEDIKKQENGDVYN